MSPPGGTADSDHRREPRCPGTSSQACIASATTISSGGQAIDQRAGAGQRNDAGFQRRHRDARQRRYGDPRQSSTSTAARKPWPSWATVSPPPSTAAASKRSDRMGYGKRRHPGRRWIRAGLRPVAWRRPRRSSRPASNSSSRAGWRSATMSAAAGSRWCCPAGPPRAFRSPRAAASSCCLVATSAASSPAADPSPQPASRSSASTRYRCSISRRRHPLRSW